MGAMNCFKRVGLILFSCLLVLFCGMSASAETSAYTAKEELPVVKQWVDSAAQDANEIYLHDTWAYDDSGISEYKYVLIGQDSMEVFRVRNYPEDIDVAKTIVPSLYTVSFDLSAPEGLTDEVNITLKSNGATYYLSFNEANEYKYSAAFYPGEYKVSEFEVVNSVAGTYALSEDLSLAVSDKNIECSLELVENTAKNTDVSSSNTVSGEVSETGLFASVKGIDSNGDLLWDTIKLFIAIALLFGVYGFIQWRRKKKEELY